MTPEKLNLIWHMLQHTFQQWTFFMRFMKMLPAAMEELVNFIIVIIVYGSPFLMLFLGFFLGRKIEKKHYLDIHQRERRFLPIPAITAKTIDDDRLVADARLAVGCVVVSVDHFKRFLMSFRQIFGGEIRSYASLIDRGRREAILRMKESYPNADLFLNCRIETATLFNGKGKATGCVEILAYSTAVSFEK